MEKTKSTHVIVSAFVKEPDTGRGWVQNQATTDRQFVHEGGVSDRESQRGILARRYLDYTTTKAGCQ